MKIILSIVNYNAEEKLRAALKNIPKTSDIFISIIDHSESANSCTVINDILKESGFLEYAVVRQKNLGYGAGHNVSLKTAQENDAGVLIINPDVTLPEDFFSVHLKSLNASNCAYMFKTEMPGGTYSALKLKGMQTEYKTTLGDELQTTDYVAGSCIYLPPDIIKKNITFDEGIFLYWEEVDLSLRLLGSGVNLLCYNGCSINRSDNPIESTINSIFYQAKYSKYINQKHKLGRLCLANYLARLLVTSLIISLKTKTFAPIRKYWEGVVCE